jgi:hypothetical protein
MLRIIRALPTLDKSFQPLKGYFSWDHFASFRQHVIPWGIRLYVKTEACAVVGVPCQNTTQEAAFEGFLENVAVLGIDEEICERCGKERGRLRQEGKLIGDFDPSKSLVVPGVVLLEFDQKG